MKRVLIAVLSILMVGILLFTGCGGISQEIENELNQLRAKEKQWIEWESELEQLRAKEKQWTEWESELEQLRAEKKNWEEIEKPALEKQVTKKEDELGDKDEKIEGLETQVAELQVELAEVPTNPDYNEVKGILFQYKARQESHQSHSQYTYQFLKMAKERGVKGYPVGVLIKPNRVLIFAAFETNDKGWIYILAATNREVQLEEGKSFRELNETSPFVGSADDTILEIMIFD